MERKDQGVGPNSKKFTRNRQDVSLQDGGREQNAQYGGREQNAQYNGRVQNTQYSGRVQYSGNGQYSHGPAEPQPRFDQRTGETLGGQDPNRTVVLNDGHSHIRFDPNTGEPVYGAEAYGNAQRSAARFDPNTGRPIGNAEGQRPKARFDPNTGRPLDGARDPYTDYEATETVSGARQPIRYDKNTGEPIYAGNPFASKQRSDIGYDPNAGQSRHADPYGNDPRSYGYDQNEELFDGKKGSDERSERNNRLFVILMVVLLSILVIGLGIVFYFVISGCNQDNKTQDAGVEQYITPVPATATPYQYWSNPEPFYGYGGFLPGTEGNPTPSPTVPPEAMTGPETNVTPPPVQSETPPTEPPTAPPTEPPTPTPTPTPSPTPTAPPTQPPTAPPVTPTPLPDSFTFGGATIPRGTTVINGKEMIDGVLISGKDGDFRHITKAEVEMLVEMCPHLTYLRLDFCWFDDYRPLSKLTDLEYLEIMSCGTENGGVTMEDIDWVAPLVNLEHLNLCHNEIYDVSALKNLKKLEWLNLGDNLLDNDALKIIAQLPKLTELYLYKEQDIDDASPLAVLEKVRVLNLANNKGLKTVESLTGMKSLQDLRLYSTGINDLSYFKNFKKLETVDLANCTKLGFDDFYYDLPKCPKLKKFRISKNDTEAIWAGEQLLSEGYELQYEIKD